MKEQLNVKERELVKAANQFKKRAQNLIKAGKLTQEHLQVAKACDNLLEQVQLHAQHRAAILQQYEQVKKIVQDNAQCPRCNNNARLKQISVFTNEKGWKMNKYKCRRCNIEFVWNRPNNPWDMLKFIDDLLVQLEDKLQSEDAGTVAQSLQLKESLLQNLATIKPIVETADKDLQDIRKKDEEMAKMLHEFKNYLLIERIKLDTWDNHSSTK